MNTTDNDTQCPSLTCHKRKGSNLIFSEDDDDFIMAPKRRLSSSTCSSRSKSKKKFCLPSVNKSAILFSSSANKVAESKVLSRNSMIQQQSVGKCERSNIVIEIQSDDSD